MRFTNITVCNLKLYAYYGCMSIKLGMLFAALLMALSGPMTVIADELPLFAAEPDVIITEIYPNAPAFNPPSTSESGNEYIEIHNKTEEVIDLTGYVFKRKNTAFLQNLDGMIIEPAEYKIIYPTFSLLNSGGTIVLEPPIGSDTPILEVTYPSLDEQHSWSLVGDIWKAEAPTPAVANPLPPETEPLPEEPPLPAPDAPIEELPVCSAYDVAITEIVANPSGNDSAGGEYIELYNGGLTAVDLTGCTLTTDKVSDFLLDGKTINAGAYLDIALIDDLLNAGGTVTYTSGAQEQSVQYPALGDDEAWALILDVWQITKLKTPGASNLSTPTEPPAATDNEDEPPACPAGKFRNPETNRCKNIVQTASSLLPCSAGETRNPATNRCRRTATLGSALVPCRAGQERNPSTNRCRKVGSNAKPQTLCQPGYERNPNTNRCRKVVGSVANTASFPVSGPAPLHPGILITMTILTLGYGIYEYRLDIGNLHSKLRTKFSKGSSSL